MIKADINRLNKDGQKIIKQELRSEEDRKQAKFLGDGESYPAVDEEDMEDIRVP